VRRATKHNVTDISDAWHRRISFNKCRVERPTSSGDKIWADQPWRYHFNKGRSCVLITIAENYKDLT